MERPDRMVFNAEDIFEDIPGDPENVMLKFPPELIEQVGWKAGDTLNITLEEGALIISKHG